MKKLLWTLFGDLISATIAGVLVYMKMYALAVFLVTLTFMTYTTLSIWAIESLVKDAIEEEKNRA